MLPGSQASPPSGLTVSALSLCEVVLSPQFLGLELLAWLYFSK